MIIPCRWPEKMDQEAVDVTAGIDPSLMCLTTFFCAFPLCDEHVIEKKI
jgi:hypothetical protein